MQVKHIVLAVAAIVAAPSAMAAALSATNVFYVSGATAQTPGLAKSISTFCANPVQAYTDDLDGSSGFVYSCSSANAASGLTVGSSFIVVKNEGGSSQGVAPVANLTKVLFPNIANCTTGAVPATYNAADVVGTPVGTCAYGTAGVNGFSGVPDIGFSDVSNAIWTARGAFTPGANAFTTAINFAGQGFGVAASDSLYVALQSEQFGASCVGSLALSCQPSISKEQYAAIITNNPGNIYQQDWSALMPNTAKTAAAADPVFNNTVGLCRRSSGSGTEASAEVYFLNTPCNAGTKLAGALSPVAAGTYDFTGTLSTNAAYAGFPSLVVTQAGSTGAVKTCLADTTNSNWSLGVMSLENAQPTNVPSSTSGSWKWLKLNGVSPNADTYQKANTVNGSYDFAFETEMLYSNGNTANVKALAAALKKELGNGANLATFYGIYADPNSGSAYSAGNTHQGSRNNNACQAHQLTKNK